MGASGDLGPSPHAGAEGECPRAGHRLCRPGKGQGAGGTFWASGGRLREVMADCAVHCFLATSLLLLLII